MKTIRQPNFGKRDIIEEPDRGSAECLNLCIYATSGERSDDRAVAVRGRKAQTGLSRDRHRTPPQFYAARFLLGFAEAGFFPGVIYYLTQWFPPDRRGRAVTRFYIAWPLSVVVMGLNDERIPGGLLSGKKQRANNESQRISRSGGREGYWISPRQCFSIYHRVGKQYLTGKSEN